MSNFSERFKKNPSPAKSIQELSPQEIHKLLDIAYKLKSAYKDNNVAQIKFLEAYLPQLILLLDYLIHNIGKLQVGNAIRDFLIKILGGEKEIEDNLLLENEEKLSKEEKERRHRLLIYEVYKITNPRRLAGETGIENFINNVLTHGLKVALVNDGGYLAKFFTKYELNNLESHKTSFLNILDEQGFKR